MSDAEAARRRRFAQTFATLAMKVSFSEGESRLIVEQITGKSPMKEPTEQQLKDPKWWDENAPEGATHFWEPSSDWYRVDSDGTTYAFYDNQWRVPCHGFRLGKERIHQRPEKPASPEWDGKTFPVPIGATCRCTFAVERHDRWHKGRCVFHGIDPEGRGYMVIDTGAYQACFRSLDHVRTIRTQAEREVEVLQEDLLGILPFCEYTDDQISEMAKILHTQGYRKPDAGMLRKGASDER